MSFSVRSSLVVGASVAIAALAGVTRAQTQDQSAAMKEIQARMKAVATPGPRHADLAGFIGTWDVDIAMVMPGAPGQRSKGTAEYSWIIQDRWLGQRIKAQMMGAPYESFSIIGYDNYAKNHVVVSVTSMDTSMVTARGLVVDPSHRVTALYGTLDEYATGELHKPFKAVTRKVDADHHQMEVWDLGIGDAGAKVLEYTFVRKK
jgi:hypothetical protein